ncbi:MAG: hypothetical protein HY234_15415 [Acidobacteria bacterium]|nr:hypothetical protein [Acidobacteriota bacterium]
MRWIRLGLRLFLGCVFAATTLAAQQPEVRTTFRVKYIADGALYIDGGRNAGLIEGNKLEIKRKDTTALPSGTSTVKAPRIIARLVVLSVAESSAVCEVTSANDEVQAGDLASLLPEDARALVERQAATGNRKYLQVITFSEGDPLDEEVRDAIPRPPLAEINRPRGRLGFEYGGLAGHGSGGARSTQLGVVLRADVTRIGASYWNFSGYWRGRVNSRRGTQQETLNDLINRTYHLGFTYSKPTSPWVAGFGRLYVPWASSLSTIDGGYVGRKLGNGPIVGLFAGSTPDPTTWNYNPDRRIAGAFVSFEGGSWDALRYTSTFGLGISSIRWRIERPFAFFEHGFFYKRVISVYHTLEADRPRAPAGMTGNTAGVSRSFLTFRVQPHQRVSFDLSHNYFRDIPTFDSRLVSTGLVDKLLFQGFSGGVRVELPRRISVYTNVGRSTKSGDARSSWNQMYGLTFGEVPWVHLRADLRYSKFDSAFGRGSYRALSLSREFGENIRIEVQGGQQTFVSPLTAQSQSHYVTTTFDWSLGTHYFLGSGFTLQRGAAQSYDLWFLNFGYRF